MSALILNTLDSNGAFVALEVEPSANTPWTLKVSGLSFNGDTFAGDDLFGAMVALRRELELQGRKLLCAGARIDVYPSGMARSMGSARNAYVIKQGEQATESIDIFAPADAATIATVEEQHTYRDQWIKSLREKLGV